MGDARAIAKAGRKDAESYAVYGRAASSARLLFAATPVAKEHTSMRFRGITLQMTWLMAVGLVAPVAASAQAKPNCADLPDAGRLKQVVQDVVKQGSSKN